MWFDDLPPTQPWSSLWYGYIICDRCRGIRRLDAACPVCQAPPPATEPLRIPLPGGGEQLMGRAFMGAEGRYEDYIYLHLLEREWKRPILDIDRQGLTQLGLPTARASIVLVFWTYFETRIERLLRHSMHTIPVGIAEDLLRRYASIGSRLDRLYRVIFATSYWIDLESLGFAATALLLQKVHQRRNEFAHGNPAAIDDGLVSELVGGLKDEHEGWIAVFNKRAAHLSL